MFWFGSQESITNIMYLISVFLGLSIVGTIIDGWISHKAMKEFENLKGEIQKMRKEQEEMKGKYKNIYEKIVSVEAILREK